MVMLITSDSRFDTEVIKAWNKTRDILHHLPHQT